MRGAERRNDLGTRVVRLRIGLVLGTDGGMLSNLLAPFEFGLGGPFGSGRQWMSWIERDDLIRLIAHIIASPQLTGAVNGTAPAPVRNAAFAQELGARLASPGAVAHAGIPAASRWPAISPTSCCSAGGACCPTRPQASGFKFRHETLPSAFSAILGRRNRARATSIVGSLKAGRRKADHSGTDLRLSA